MRTMDVGGVSLYDNIVIDKLKQKKTKDANRRKFYTNFHLMCGLGV